MTTNRTNGTTTAKFPQSGGNPFLAHPHWSVTLTQVNRPGLCLKRMTSLLSRHILFVRIMPRPGHIKIAELRHSEDGFSN